jgi:phage FluMu gp28-like protein
LPIKQFDFSKRLLAAQRATDEGESLHPAQRQVVEESRRFNVVCCGRRWGKTVLGLNRLVIPAKQGRPVGWFSPTYKMLAEVWRDARRELLPIAARINAQEHRIELNSGGVVEMWSLDNPDNSRGRKYARVVIDEAAMVKALGEAWQAVIRPTLTDYEGDAWFLSTPKGMNFFWELYQRGLDDGQPDYRAWQMPTSANPYIKPSEIEAAERELPERVFAQEYLAQFLDSAGGVFRRVREAATAYPLAHPEPGHTYVGGIDWARSHDFTVLSVMDAGTKRQVALDRFNQIGYEVQLGRFRAMHERFGVSAWVAEENSMGGPLIERLQSEGYPVQAFKTTNATKAQVIDALALAFERGEITILDDAVQIAELQAYEMERLPSGLIRYRAPENMHDDTVMALALNWYGVSNPAELTETVNPFYG